MNMPYNMMPQMPMVQAPFNTFNKLPMAPPLYVGDLDENIHDETLHDFFSKFGPLHFVRIMRDPASGKSRGFGYVNFIYPRDAESARQLAQYEKLGRKHIRIMFKRNVRDLPPEANLFVKNIDPSVTVKDLHAHFLQAGVPVLCAKVATNSEGQSLGYGYVQFEKKEDAESALGSLQGSRLKENDLNILPFVPKDKRVGTASKKNIYVKHLPINQSEDDLTKLVHELFSDFGEIETHVVKKHPKEQKYSAFVCFKEEEAAQAAVDELSKNPPDLGSPEGPLYVSWHQNKAERIRELKRQYQQVQNETNLYVKNLRPEVTDNDLKKAFQQFGPISSVAVKEWHSSDGQKKARFGFIAFQHPEDAQKAFAEAVAIPEIAGLYLPDAIAYINIHQSKDRRKEYIYSQKKLRSQLANMTGMPPMGALPGMGPMGAMGNPGFPGMQMGALPNRKFGPMPNMMNTQLNKQPPFARGGPGGPRVHKQGWSKGPTGPRPGMGQRGETGPRTQPGNMQKGGLKPQGPQVPQAGRPVAAHPGNKPPIQNQPQAQPAAPSSGMTVQNLRTRLSEFLQLDQDRQRQILGELLFPLVKGISGENLAPKITGMLIDLSVLEVTEILEFLENHSLLEERVTEAIELIESEGI